MTNYLDRDQRSMLWDMRHPEVAKDNLARASTNTPDGHARLARADFKWRECAHLILHHGYTTVDVLAEAWELSYSRTRTTLRNWIRRGALIDARLPVSGRRLILLSPAGLAEARSTIDPRLSAPTQVNRVGRTLFEHTIACQRAAVDHDNGGPRTGLHNYDWYAVEENIASHPHRARFDVALADDHDATVIEAELSRKSPARLKEKMESLAAVILDPDIRITDAVWVCPPGQVADAIHRAHDRLDDRLTQAADAIRIESPGWITYPI